MPPCAESGNGVSTAPRLELRACRSSDFAEMKIVAAPNPCKGSLGAPAAAAAIRRGVHRVWPEAEVAEVPIADGGEGTVEALVAAHNGELATVTVEGPLGTSVEACFGLIDGGATAVVELAAASGLPLLDDAQRDPRRASTYGFGQLLEVLVVAHARVAPHQTLHRRVRLKRRRVDTHALRIGQPMLAQNLQDPLHHPAMGLHRVQSSGPRHRRMIRR